MVSLFVPAFQLWEACLASLMADGDCVGQKNRETESDVDVSSIWRQDILLSKWLQHYISLFGRLHVGGGGGGGRRGGEVG